MVVVVVPRQQEGGSCDPGPGPDRHHSTTQAALVRIDEEEAKLRTLRTAVFEEGLLRWSEAHQPILATCRVDMLEQACWL